MKRICIGLVCALFLLALPLTMALAEGQAYYITDAEIGTGGAQLSSENFSVQDNLGAAAVGNLESENYSLESGNPEYTWSNDITSATPEGLGTLIGELIAVGEITANVETGLMAKIEAAQAALDRGNPNANLVAMNNLRALVNQVEDQTGTGVTDRAADLIITKAEEVIAALQE